MAEKKNRGKVAQQVFDLARPVAEEMGLLLWDVDFYKEGAEFNLLVTIDRPEGGVGLSDCEALSRALSPLLDEADPIEESYCLEVSSAGLCRELVRPEHFSAFAGKPVEARLYAPRDGKKSLKGILVSRTDEGITVALPEGEVTLPLNAVAKVVAADEDE